MIKLGTAMHYIGDSFLFVWSSLETILLFVSVTTIDTINTITNTLTFITSKVIKTISITTNNSNTNTTNAKVSSNLSLLQSSGIKSGLILPKKANNKGDVLDKIVKNFPTEKLLASSSLSASSISSSSSIASSSLSTTSSSLSSSLSSNQFKMPVVNNNIRPILTNIYNDNNDSDDSDDIYDNDNDTINSNTKNSTNSNNDNTVINDSSSNIIHLLAKTSIDIFKSVYKYCNTNTNTNTNASNNDSNNSSNSSSNSSNTYSIAPHLFTCLCILSYIVSRKYSNVCIQITIIIITTLLVFVYITALDNLYRKKILTSIGIDAINDFVNKHPQSYPYSKKGITRGGKSDYEVSNWFNIITGAIWNIEGANEIGGYGPYLAKSIEQSLNIELARVPPGIAKLQLKNFNLGTKAPIIRALKVTPYRIPDTSCTKTPITNINNKNIGSKMHGELWKWYEKLNKNRNDKEVVIKGCEHLIIEIDVGYVSKEMDIILSLRSNDINSVLPEASVTVSTLAMAGIITLDAELIPEYPFFGNATFSFKELPNLEMTLSSFGGVDLSAIPGVRNFIDISLKWLMSQYTNPNVGTINMISYLCPSCLEIEPEPKTYIDKVIKMTKLLYSYLRQKTKSFMTKKTY